MTRAERLAPLLNRLASAGLLLLVALLPVLVWPTAVEHASPTVTGLEMLDSGHFANPFIEARFRLLLGGATVLLALTLAELALRAAGAPVPGHRAGLMALAALGGCIVVSQLASPFPKIAALGFYDQREGTLTWLAYLALGIVAARCRSGAGPRRRLLLALVPFVAVNAGLAVASLMGAGESSYGVDSRWLTPVKTWLYPGVDSMQLSALPLTNTLGSANYASGFGAVCTAVFASAALLAHRAVTRAWTTLCALLSFVVVVGSLSRSGFVSLVLVSPLLGWLAWRHASRRAAVLTAVALLLGFASILTVSAHLQPRVWTETVRWVPGVRNFLRAPDVREAGNDTAAGSPAPQWDSVGSGRGYIWRQVFALGTERPLRGWGLDTLGYAYPQWAHLAAGTARGELPTVVTKAHSLYLGLWYGAGSVALAAFLALVSLPLANAAGTLFRSGHIEASTAALFAGAATFLVQGLVNDSMVGTTAILVVFLGALMQEPRQSRGS